MIGRWMGSSTSAGSRRTPRAGGPDLGPPARLHQHRRLLAAGARAGAGERYRPIAPDIRGHGTASELMPVTLDAVLGDIASLAPAGGFTLAGYSMGGRIALHAALAMPERVDRLVLISASPGLADPAEREARLRADEQLAAEFESSTIDELASRWALTPVLAGLPAAAAAVARADRLRNTPAGLARALRGLGTGALPSLWDRLGELAMPVTLVAGERDREVPSRSPSEMRALIPAATVTVIPDAGHAAHLENPAAVAGSFEAARHRAPYQSTSAVSQPGAAGRGHHPVAGGHRIRAIEPPQRRQAAVTVRRDHRARRATRRRSRAGRRASRRRRPRTRRRAPRRRLARDR